MYAYICMGGNVIEGTSEAISTDIIAFLLEV